MLNSLLIGVGAIVGIVVVALVIILVIAVVVWWIKTANALVRLNRSMGYHRRIPEEEIRSHSQPGGNRERLCKARKRNAYQRCGGA